MVAMVADMVADMVEWMGIGTLRPPKTKNLLKREKKLTWKLVVMKSLTQIRPLMMIQLLMRSLMTKKKLMRLWSRSTMRKLLIQKIQRKLRRKLLHWLRLKDVAVAVEAGVKVVMEDGMEEVVVAEVATVEAGAEAIMEVTTEVTGAEATMVDIGVVAITVVTGVVAITEDIVGDIVEDMAKSGDLTTW